MKTERLLQSGVLNSGEPRHYASWELPQVPRLDLSPAGGLHDALYRRQKAHAPRVGRGRVGWMQFWYALRRAG